MQLLGSLGSSLGYLLRRLRLLLLSLRMKHLHLALLLVRLLPLDGRQQIVSFKVFRVIVAHTLFLHLPEFLQQVSIFPSLW